MPTIRLIDYGEAKVHTILALRRAYGISLKEAYEICNLAPTDLPALPLELLERLEDELRSVHGAKFERVAAPATSECPCCRGSGKVPPCPKCRGSRFEAMAGYFLVAPPPCSECGGLGVEHA
jgi:hypothetical protein